MSFNLMPANSKRSIAVFAMILAIPFATHAQDTDVMADLTTIATEGASKKPSRETSGLSCARYKVYYIDPSAQFFTPPVPLEDHAEYVFCSEHANLDEIRIKLKKLKPIRSQADAESARIKVVPRGRADDAIIFCSTGEITYRGKQYRLDRRAYEPSLLSLREEGDRQRALAIENENDDEPRGPASDKSSTANPTSVSPSPSPSPSATPHKK